jgi:hypothetical protein
MYVLSKKSISVHVSIFRLVQRESVALNTFLQNHLSPKVMGA